MPFATVGELRICYELSGPEAAPLLVFSNSLGTDLSMWDSQAKTLAREFRILRYDMRGQGKSCVIPGDSSIEQFGRDFIGLIDALNLKSVIFCGLSMGGMIRHVARSELSRETGCTCPVQHGGDDWHKNDMEYSDFNCEARGNAVCVERRNRTLVHAEVSGRALQL